jgi:16S rRNA (uracil1498-N3)-methyltransferase
LARYDFAANRLYVDADLSVGALAPLNAQQTNYLRAALRLKDGDRMLAFNGRQGEWLCELEGLGRKATGLRAREQVRVQESATDVHSLFAPLKHARQDYLVQKAVEMGAARLRPVLTRRTQVRLMNAERARANAIEAAEQCGLLTLPRIDDPVDLSAALETLEADRLLVFCDEDAARHDPIQRLRAARRETFAVLIGPEGGFDPLERAMIQRLPNAVSISLGPRILRADTAAVAALAIVQAAIGDGR